MPLPSTRPSPPRLWFAAGSRKPPPVAAGGMFCCCSCPVLPLPAVVVMSPAFSSVLIRLLLLSSWRICLLFLRSPASSSLLGLALVALLRHKEGKAGQQLAAKQLRIRARSAMPSARCTGADRARRPCAPGLTSRGNPFDTCCRSCACARGRAVQHDPDCEQRYLQSLAQHL